MLELQNMLYKTELNHARQTRWTNRQEVEPATTRWMTWFNQRRHSALNGRSPLDAEAAYTHQQSLPKQAA